MVRQIELPTGNVVQSKDILSSTEVGLPKATTAKLKVAIEQHLLKLTFDVHPTIELPAPVRGVNSWIEDGELTVALTGYGRRATFKNVVLGGSALNK